jgi:hypothetical protein
VQDVSSQNNLVIKKRKLCDEEEPKSSEVVDALPETSKKRLVQNTYEDNCKDCPSGPHYIGDAKKLERHKKTVYLRNYLGRAHDFSATYNEINWVSSVVPLHHNNVVLFHNVFI